MSEWVSLSELYQTPNDIPFFKKISSESLTLHCICAGVCLTLSLVMQVLSSTTGFLARMVFVSFEGDVGEEKRVSLLVDSFQYSAIVVISMVPSWYIQQHQGKVLKIFPLFPAQNGGVSSGIL